MAESQAHAAYGTLIEVGDGGTPETFVVIAEVTSIAGPAQTRDTIDVTHMESPEGYREFIPSFKDGGTVTLALNFLPNDPTQDATDGIIADYENDVKRNYRITWPTAGTNRVSFSAYVTDHSPDSPVEGKMDLAVTLKISGKPTWSAA
jgi:hypothetical protein